jgi:hypothetical protein
VVIKNLAGEAAADATVSSSLVAQLHAAGSPPEVLNIAAKRTRRHRKARRLEAAEKTCHWAQDEIVSLQQAHNSDLSRSRSSRTALIKTRR